MYILTKVMHFFMFSQICDVFQWLWFMIRFIYLIIFFADSRWMFWIGDENMLWILHQCLWLELHLTNLDYGSMKVHTKSCYYLTLTLICTFFSITRSVAHSSMTAWIWCAFLKNYIYQSTICFDKNFKVD